MNLILKSIFTGRKRVVKFCENLSIFYPKMIFKLLQVIQKKLFTVTRLSMCFNINYIITKLINALSSLIFHGFSC